MGEDEPWMQSLIQPAMNQFFRGIKGYNDFETFHERPYFIVIAVDGEVVETSQEPGGTNLKSILLLRRI